MGDGENGTGTLGLSTQMSALETMKSVLATSFRSMATKKKINVEDGNQSKLSQYDTLNTDKSIKKLMRKTKGRDADDDDGVLIGDDISSHEGKKKKDLRYTPLGERRPKIVFHEDPNMLDEYKQMKQKQFERMKVSASFDLAQ